MAEIYIHVGSGGPDESSYSDGDVIQVFTDCCIKSRNCQNIINPWDFHRNSHGLLDLGTLQQRYYELTHEYRFERIGNTVKRIDLLNSKEQDVSINMDIPIFMSDRYRTWKKKQRRGKPMFGSKGKEVWYGGEIDHSEPVFDKLIIDIKNKMGKTDSDFDSFKGATKTLKYHLGLKINNLKRSEADAMTAEVKDQDGTVITKRTNKVSWKEIGEISGNSINRILDKDIKVDLRSKGLHLLEDIVQQKG